MYNLALKLALLESGRPAYAIAAAAGISETRLSRLVTGRVEPGLEEARVLSGLLGRSVNTLFPDMLFADEVGGEDVGGEDVGDAGSGADQ